MEDVSDENESNPGAPESTKDDIALDEAVSLTDNDFGSGYDDSPEMLRLEQEENELRQQYKSAPPLNELRPSTPKLEMAAKEIFQPERTVSHPTTLYNTCLRALRLYQTMFLTADVLLHYPELPERLFASEFQTKIPNYGLCFQRAFVRPLLICALL